MASLKENSRYRVVMMGAAAVGKSCIVSRFMYESFREKYKATVEELHADKYEVNGVPVKLEILDTAGAYQFPAMRKLSISTGDAFILVYSVDDEYSFNEVKRLRDEIMEYRDNNTCEPPIVVVGNKVDLDKSKRVICEEEAESTANIDWNNGYVEVSAKEDVNVDLIFHELLVQAKISVNLRPFIVRNNKAPNLSKTPKSNRKLTKRDSCVIS